MKIERVTVGLPHQFNDPFERFGNLRPSVTFEARLDDGDDPSSVVLALQARCRAAVHAERERVLEWAWLRSRDKVLVGRIEELETDLKGVEDVMHTEGDTPEWATTRWSEIKNSIEEVRDALGKVRERIAELVGEHGIPAFELVATEQRTPIPDTIDPDRAREFVENLPPEPEPPSSGLVSTAISRLPTAPVREEDRELLGERRGVDDE